MAFNIIKMQPYSHKVVTQAKTLSAAREALLALAKVKKNSFYDGEDAFTCLDCGIFTTYKIFDA